MNLNAEISNRIFKIKQKPVTEKFYARHEALTAELSDHRKKIISKNLNYLDNTAERAPQDKNSLPETENQLYGWLWPKSFQYDRMDCEFFCCHKKTDDLMRILAKVDVENNKFKKNRS